jgi:iron complex transport system substrate-binding protein
VCAVTEETVEQSLRFATVEATCSADLLSLIGTDRDGVRADLLAVGAAAGVEARAEALVAALDSAWAALPGPNDGGPKVLMLEWSDPPWYGGHWVPEQVRVAGGVDAFGSAGQASGRLDWDRVHAADPEVVVVMACGLGLADNLEQARRVFSDPARSSLQAVRSGQVWAADANALFSRPGPRIVEGAALLARIFAGDPVPEHQAARVAL